LLKRNLLMKLKFKKLHPNAAAPAYSREGDAAFDLTAISCQPKGEHYIEYGTGIALEIPEGHVGLLFPRSSVTNKSMILKNSVGVIDSNYRGEVKLRFSSINVDPILRDQFYKIGERIGQMILVPIPTLEFEEVEELSDSNRGTGAWGSSGK
jgi:dUTP pyrophosphatase